MQEILSFKLCDEIFYVTHYVHTECIPNIKYYFYMDSICCSVYVPWDYIY